MSPGASHSQKESWKLRPRENYLFAKPKRKIHRCKEGKICQRKKRAPKIPLNQSSLPPPTPPPPAASPHTTPPKRCSPGWPWCRLRGSSRCSLRLRHSHVPKPSSLKYSQVGGEGGGWRVFGGFGFSGLGCRRFGMG